MENCTYLLFHTRFEDILVCLLGWFLTVGFKWWMDKKKFEAKRKLARNFPLEYASKYGKDGKQYANSKWNWSLWIDDHDEDFIFSFFCSIALILGIPEGWDLVKSIVFNDTSDTPFNTVIALILGMFGLPIVVSLMAAGKGGFKKLSNLIKSKLGQNVEQD